MAELVQHVDLCGIQDFREDDIVIAFMGPTGVGKSYFIDLLTGQKGKRASYSRESATHEVGGIRVKHKIYGDRIVLIDTPGFGNTIQSNVNILEMIAKWFRKIYEDQKIVLSGLIYLHPITDNRMPPASREILHVFGRLCGNSAISRVTMVTTVWDDLRGMSTGEEREKELKRRFWKSFTNRGCQVDRLDPAEEGRAWGIIERFIITYQDRKPILLQEELVDLKMQLSQTSAGKAVHNFLIRGRLRDKMKAIMSLLGELKKLEKDLEKDLKMIPGDPEKTRTLRKSMEHASEELQRVHQEVEETLMPAAFISARFVSWFLARTRIQQSTYMT